MKITITCSLCAASHDADIQLPEGWSTRYDGTDVEDGFCPKHQAVAAFAESQCPGCVGGWTDCPMWKAFAYSHGRDIRPSDYKAIEQGICPRRVNGTMSISRGAAAMQDIDLSDRAPPESGAAFAQAIRDYCEAYPVGTR